MPRPRASVRFSSPSMRSSCEPTRNGRRPPVHAPQKTPKETLVNPPPNLLLTTYKGSRRVGLNLTGLLIKLPEVARRTSGSVGSSTHECCGHPYVYKLLFTLRWTDYGSHGRVEPRRTNNSSITYPHTIRRCPRYEQERPIPEFRWILACGRRHHAVRGSELHYGWSPVPMEGPKT